MGFVREREGVGVSAEGQKGVGKGERGDEEEEEVECLVSEEYLGLLVRIANERFVVNEARMRRFADAVCKGLKVKSEPGGEDRNSRRARKKREGLRVRERKAGIVEREAIERRENEKKERDKKAGDFTEYDDLDDSYEVG